MKTVLRNLFFVNPEQGLNQKGDILIVDGVIRKVGELNEDEMKDCSVHDFEGSYCSPGFYDMHVHLREPGREDKETVQTGCNAAANGGFTGVACMPNTTPAIDAAEVIYLIKAKAGDHLVDVNPVAAVTVGREGEVLSPMSELIEAGAVGFSDDGTAVKSSMMLRTGLEYASMFNAPIIEHCEDDSLKDGLMNESFNSTLLGMPPLPSVSEDIIVMRDILMAEYTGGRVHIAHISTAGAVEMVRQAKARGVKVTAEATPHHFTLTDDALKTYDTNYKMSPPLRTVKDRDAVIAGLKDGTIDVIASDHAPHTIEEKEHEFEFAPNGIVGLETMVGLTLSELFHTEVLTLEQIVEKLAVNPRKILNLAVPVIAEGETANLTIFDPAAEWEVDITRFKTKGKNSPFGGRKLIGRPVAVINKGTFFNNGSFSRI